MSVRVSHSEGEDCLECPVFKVFSLGAVVVNCLCSARWQCIGNQRTDGWASCRCQGEGQDDLGKKTQEGIPIPICLQFWLTPGCVHMCEANTKQLEQRKEVVDLKLEL